MLKYFNQYVGSWPMSKIIQCYFFFSRSMVIYGILLPCLGYGGTFYTSEGSSGVPQ